MSVLQTRLGRCAWKSRANTRHSNQLLDAVQPDRASSESQLGVHPGASVGPSALGVDDGDVNGELSVAPLRLGSLPPGIEASPRDTQQTAHHRDRQARPCRPDPPEHHLLSLANQAAVFFRSQAPSAAFDSRGGASSAPPSRWSSTHSTVPSRGAPTYDGRLSQLNRSSAKAWSARLLISSSSLSSIFP